MMRRIKRQLIFARYTPLSQVTARLLLMVKRKVFSRLPLMEKAPALANLPLPLAAAPPAAIFPPRHKATALPDERFRLTFLHQAREFRLPFNWHPEDLATGTRLWKLNLHYHEFLEGLAPDQALRIIKDWISQNDPYRNTYWMDSWNSYSLSIRVVVWMQRLAEFRRAGIEIPAVIDRSLVRQMRFLVANLELDIGGNHLIKNIKALLWAARYYGGSEPQRWSKLGSRLLRAELARQILDDGFHYEISPAYHCQVLADLLDIRAALQSGDLCNALDGILERMMRVALKTTHPDGGPALFGDCGLKMAYPAQACLDAYRSLVGPFEDQETGDIALPDAGFYGVRSEQDFLLVAMGDLGPDRLMAHAHGHWGSLEWSLEGQRIIVDQGVFEYNAGPRRSLSRATSAHNTARIEGREQADFFGAFRCGARPHPQPPQVGRDGATWVIEGELADHLPAGMSQVRGVSMGDGVLTLSDSLRGGTPGRRIEGGLLLHPEVKAGRDASGIWLLKAGEIRIAVSADPAVTVELEPAEWWPDMGASQPTSRLVYRGVDATEVRLRRV